MKSVLLALGFAALAAANAHGQCQVVFDVPFDRANSNFGASLAPIGDLDHDGTADFMVGAPRASTPAGSNAGSVFVVSGRTGTIIRRFDGAQAQAEFGTALSETGDVSGDQRPDLLVGVPLATVNGFPGAGIAFMINGVTGAEIWRVEGSQFNDLVGASVARVGELDGDGTPDFVNGAPGKDPGGRIDAGAAIVVSGATGGVIRTIEGATAGIGLGGTVARLGDVNSDSVPDVLVAAPSADGGGHSDSGAVFGFSGVTFVSLWEFDGPEDSILAGTSLAGTDDISGDGVPDVLVGAPRADPYNITNAGSVFLVSGANGVSFRRLNGIANGDAFGSSVAGLGDVNGGGGPDLAVGAPLANGPAGIDAGRVYLYSGATGTFLRFEGTYSGGHFGASVAGPTDLTGDGRRDAIGSSPSADPGNLPSAGVVSALGCDPILSALAGRVDTGDGSPPADVLLINGSSGGSNHSRPIPRNTPVDVGMISPPSRVGRPSGFALYLRRGLPTVDSLTPHPFNLGTFAFPTPISGGSPQPNEIWNNLRHEATLGFPTRPSQPAPTTVFSRASGIRRAIDATFQGVIADDNSPHPQGFSITNGIRLRIF